MMHRSPASLTFQFPSIFYWEYWPFVGFLCPRPSGSWGFKWSLGIPIIPWGSLRKLATTLAHRKSFSLSAIKWMLGAAPKKSDDLISGSRCRFSMCVVHDNKQHWCRLPIMRELRQDYLCELTRCNNSSPTKTRLFVLTRGCKYG